MDRLPKIFFEVHSELPREGPGDNESTRKAYRMLKDLPPNPRILDVGCGPGMQTIELAKLSNGRIDALDYFPHLLDQLRKSAQQENVAQNITAVRGDMFKLNYPKHSFDLIWSEGAIYIIGFEKGLREWQPLLTKNGYTTVTHISWLKPNPPEELREFWEKNYPQITMINENLQIANNLGYSVVGYFVLPKESWETYYRPIEAKLSALITKYKNDVDALNYLASEEQEISMHRKYSDYYGYVFFILQVKS